MAYPPIVIVDKDNRVVGSAMLQEAWAKGLYYRVVGILVEDENGRILLQKRAPGMEVDPGSWDLSAAGHVQEGQTYQVAAACELEEELGLKQQDLEDLGVQFYSYINGGRHMNSFLNLYSVVVPSDTSFHVDGYEVSDTRWFAREELASLLREHPEQFSRFVKEIMARTPALLQPQPAPLVQ